MTDRPDPADRLMDIWIGEVVGGDAPPDLTDRIMAAAANELTAEADAAHAASEHPGGPDGDPAVDPATPPGHAQAPDLRLVQENPQMPAHRRIRDRRPDRHSMWWSGSVAAATLLIATLFVAVIVMSDADDPTAHTPDPDANTSRAANDDGARDNWDELRRHPRVQRELRAEWREVLEQPVRVDVLMVQGVPSGMEPRPLDQFVRSGDMIGDRVTVHDRDLQRQLVALLYTGIAEPGTPFRGPGNQPGRALRFTMVDGPIDLQFRGNMRRVFVAGPGGSVTIHGDFRTMAGVIDSLLTGDTIADSDHPLVLRELSLEWRETIERGELSVMRITSWHGDGIRPGVESFADGHFPVTGPLAVSGADRVALASAIYNGIANPQRRPLTAPEWALGVRATLGGRVVDIKYSFATNRMAIVGRGDATGMVDIATGDAARDMILRLLTTAGLPGAKAIDQLGERAVRALERGTSLTLTSISPSQRGGRNTIDGYPVFGRLPVPRAERRNVLRALYESLDYDGPIADCFEPRHVIETVFDDETVQIVICFTCHQGRMLLPDGNRRNLYLGTAARDLYNRLLLGAGITVDGQGNGRNTDFRAAANRALGDDAVALLEEADRLELLSVSPSEGTPDPGFTSVGGHPVFGGIDIAPVDRARVLDALYGSLANMHPMAACFLPRHVIRATRGTDTLTLLICFECNQIEVYAPDGSERTINTGPHARDLFNRLLAEARVHVDGQNGRD